MTKFVDSITRREVESAGSVTQVRNGRYVDCFVREKRNSGFGLRVAASGLRTFIWEGRVRGRGVTRRVSLGVWEDGKVTVAEMRAKAARCRADAKAGKDPAAVALAPSELKKFGDLITWYLEKISKPHKKSWHRDEVRLRAYNRWYGRLLTDIRPDHINQVHLDVAKTRGQVIANRTTSLLRTVYNAAIAMEVYTGANPVKLTSKQHSAGIKLFREQPRRRYLTSAELIKVNDALMEETAHSWRFKAYFPLLLMLGLRRSELAGLRWDQVDLKAQMLTIPQTKSGTPQTEPIPSPATAILEGLPSRGTSEWVFPAKSRSGHLMEPTHVWKKVRERAGCADVTIHSLRHTLASWMLKGGYGLGVIGAALNHARAATTQRYAHMQTEPVREALEATALKMFGPATDNK